MMKKEMLQEVIKRMETMIRMYNGKYDFANAGFKDTFFQDGKIGVRFTNGKRYLFDVDTMTVEPVV